MQSKESFTPSKQILSAARDVLIRQAALEIVAQIVGTYEREILAEERWSASAHWGDHFPEGKTILDPKDTYLLSEADSAVFTSRCHQSRDRAKLKVSQPDDCPRCEAEWQLIQAEWRLVDLMESITGVSRESMLCQGLGRYKQYIDATLCLLSVFLEPSAELMLSEANHGL